MFADQTAVLILGILLSFRSEISEMPKVVGLQKLKLFRIDGSNITDIPPFSLKNLPGRIIRLFSKVCRVKSLCIGMKKMGAGVILVWKILWENGREALSLAVPPPPCIVGDHWLFQFSNRFSPSSS
jgi:hypothetical protein